MNICKYVWSEIEILQHWVLQGYTPNRRARKKRLLNVTDPAIGQKESYADAGRQQLTVSPKGLQCKHD